MSKQTVLYPPHCPTARTLPTGEQECPKCGMTWDRDDGPPDCQNRAIVPARGNQALKEMRRTLRSTS